MNQEQFATTYLLTNAKYFPNDKITYIQERLNFLSENKQNLLLLQSTNFKDPLLTLIFSLLLGCFGVDRFYLGQTGLGILKLILSLMAIGWIWVVIDLFLSHQKAKELNFEQVMTTLSDF